MIVGVRGAVSRRRSVAGIVKNTRTIPNVEGADPRGKAVPMSPMAPAAVKVRRSASGIAVSILKIRTVNGPRIRGLRRGITKRVRLKGNTRDHHLRARRAPVSARGSKGLAAAKLKKNAAPTVKLTLMILLARAVRSRVRQVLRSDVAKPS